jgi:hypothetical protein
MSSQVYGDAVNRKKHSQRHTVDLGIPVRLLRAHISSALSETSIFNQVKSLGKGNEIICELARFNGRDEVSSESDPNFCLINILMSAID